MRQEITKLASAPPLVTSTCDGEAPVYSAAIRSRSAGEPFEGLYSSAVASTEAGLSPASSMSSPNVSGSTPLSERL